MDRDIKILNREETVREIEKLIYYAKKSIILISPYIKLTESMKDKLTSCRAKNKILIFREDTELYDELFLKKTGFEMNKAKNLHSKIYFNENWIIFSSMNLYHYSIKNNYESSIMLRTENIKDKDFKVIGDIIKNSKKH